jgi:hypothetical protein
LGFGFVFDNAVVPGAKVAGTPRAGIEVRFKPKRRKCGENGIAGGGLGRFFCFSK